ncbi:MAG: hypothetical protein IIB88_09320, partial [Chloroflexi bacterium]|nr:hypothetical protein [Chloroflexota bacterium]
MHIRVPTSPIAAVAAGMVLAVAMACGGGGSSEPRAITALPSATPDPQAADAGALPLERFAYEASLTLQGSGDDARELFVSTRGIFVSPDQHAFTYRTELGEGEAEQQLVMVDGSVWYRAGDGPWQKTELEDELVQDLLEFSRIGSSISSRIEAIDVGEFVREMIASLHPSAEVEIVIGSDLPTIEADRTLLRQVFQNLIANAIKFNRSGRKRVEIGWLPVTRQRCELFVRDNGIGIEPRFHEQIFRIFERLHTREEYEGTGIGLALVAKAASRLQGSVRLESKVSEGSTFFVALPKRRRPRAPTSERSDDDELQTLHGSEGRG